MSLILCLETSTKNCSVCLSREGKVISITEQSSDQYLHSEKLHLFIREVLERARSSTADLSAVALSKGPGSYTGLRIGASAAKGLCYVLQIPLIAVDTLSILVRGYLKGKSLSLGEIAIPMLDARRMEVYCAIYNHAGEAQTQVEAKIIDENSFWDIDAKKIHLIGEGASKSMELLDSNPRFVLGDLRLPSASDMSSLAHTLNKQAKFENLTYFEPFYLKSFLAGNPKKVL